MLKEFVGSPTMLQIFADDSTNNAVLNGRA